MNRLLPLIILAFAFGCQSEIKKEATSKRPNILLAICDDMSYGHLSYNNYPEVNTPHIDQLAHEGVYFEQAYCSTPSCSPSRAAILTGRNGYELKEGGILFAFLPDTFKTYPDILEENGYFVGFTGKPWAPGSNEMGNRERNPAGNEYNDIKNMPFVELGNKNEIWEIDYAENFKAFLNDKPDDKPFCFWYGALEPHRAYATGIGERAGKNPKNVDVPPFLVDNETTRQDILDYLFEIEWFDTQLGEILEEIEKRGELENTLVLITSDNGMPFPRAKANLYNYGVHMPLIAYWPDKVKQPKHVSDLVNLASIAPTFLEAAGIDMPKNMSLNSILTDIVSEDTGLVTPADNFVVTYKERHAWVQPDGKMYPMRSIRKGDYAFIWNMKPDMWPAGHINPTYNFDNFPFGDVDDGPAKFELMKLKNSKNDSLFDLAFGKRPEFELYNYKKDPYNFHNLAYKDEFIPLRDSLKTALEEYLIKTGDPRMKDGGNLVEMWINAPFLAQKGIFTGGLWLDKWEALDSAGKAEAVKKERKKLEAQQRRLNEEFGW